ncbi:MAG: helix-turn-helix domain-containing protein [Sphingomonas sp.]|nr:helix-turn-helix domain-containing protein [Sphingomonas sp.]
MEPLWDEEETARYIGKSVSTLQKERLRGDGLPFVKLGRSVRYRPEDVHAFIAARIVNSTSEVA